MVEQTIKDGEGEQEQPLLHVRNEQRMEDDSTLHLKDMI